MFELIAAIAAKVTSVVGGAGSWVMTGWVGYAVTAVVATTVTSGAIVGLSASGVVNITSGLGQEAPLASGFNFKPSALNSLDQIYGAASAGISAAFTGAGIKLDPLAVGAKITAVSSKIIAQAAADKTALQTLSNNVSNLTGFQPSDTSKQVAGTTPTVLVAAAISPTALGGGVGVLGTSTPVSGAIVGTTTPTPQRTLSITPTRTVFATGTPTITATPITTSTPSVTPSPVLTSTATHTATPVPTSTFTPTPTATPLIQVSNGGTAILNIKNLIPGGPGVSQLVTVTNIASISFTYGVSATCVSSCNLLWTDTVNGLQLAIDDVGGLPAPVPTRDPKTPAVQVPGSALILPTTPISGVRCIQTNINVHPQQSSTIAVTVWLPDLLGVPPLAGLSARTPTPNPGNAFQGLSLSVDLTWDAFVPGQPFCSV